MVLPNGWNSQCFLCAALGAAEAKHIRHGASRWAWSSAHSCHAFFPSCLSTCGHQGWCDNLLPLEFFACLLTLYGRIIFLAIAIFCTFSWSVFSFFVEPLSVSVSLYAITQLTIKKPSKAKVIPEPLFKPVVSLCAIQYWNIEGFKNERQWNCGILSISKVHHPILPQWNWTSTCSQNGSGSMAHKSPLIHWPVLEHLALESPQWHWGQGSGEARGRWNSPFNLEPITEVKQGTLKRPDIPRTLNWLPQFLHLLGAEFVVSREKASGGPFLSLPNFISLEIACRWPLGPVLLEFKG